MVLAFTIFSLIYSCMSIMLYVSWRHIGTAKGVAKPTSSRHQDKKPRIAHALVSNGSNLEDEISRDDILITVVIPVRNEAENIMQLLLDLNNQVLAPELFEVIIIDDGSEDGTRMLIENTIATLTYRISVHTVDLEPGYTGSHKKLAITQAVQRAQGKYILTTDGDCRVQPGWLATLASFVEINEPACISGPVSFIGGGNLLQRFQEIEFAALIGTGAGSLHLGFPNMCNGANLAFKKDAFAAVGGYAGNEHIHSGDDEFLMHKIYALYRGSVFFLKDFAYCVHTQAKSTLKDLFYQRRRWAGKWKMYTDKKIIGFALFIFIYNVLAMATMAMVLAGHYPLWIFIGQIMLKFAAEFLFLKSVMEFLKKPLPIIHFLITQLVYPFYIFIIGIAANFGYYEWKGRRIK